MSPQPDHFDRFLRKIRGRFGALVDGSAWSLILPALVALWFIDPPMAKTLAQWSLYFLVLAGMVVVISRVIFPSVNLDTLLDKAERGEVAPAVAAAAIVLFVALLVLAFVLWARPVG